LPITATAPAARASSTIRLPLLVSVEQITVGMGVVRFSWPNRTLSRNGARIWMSPADSPSPCRQ